MRGPIPIMRSIPSTSQTSKLTPRVTPDDSLDRSSAAQCVPFPPRKKEFRSPRRSEGFLPPGKQSHRSLQHPRSPIRWAHKPTGGNDDANLSTESPVGTTRTGATSKTMRPWTITVLHSLRNLVTILFRSIGNTKPLASNGINQIYWKKYKNHMSFKDKF